MSSNLKPCPFCGSEAFEDAQFGREHWVQCGSADCAATTGIVYDNAHDACVAWNHRVAYSDEPKEMTDEQRDDRDVYIKTLAVRYSHEKTTANIWVFENHDLLKFAYSLTAKGKENEQRGSIAPVYNGQQCCKISVERLLNEQRQAIAFAIEILESRGDTPLTIKYLRTLLAEE